MNIIQKLSPNFGSREGNVIKCIVVHIMAGSLAGTDDWFSRIESQVSSHYGIGLGGEIHQYVADENMAWANGSVQKPTAKIIIDNIPINPNKFSISIENEGYDLSKAPESQLAALVILIQVLAAKHNIPMDRTHIIGHREVNSIRKPTCPSFDNSIMDELVKQCQEVSNKEGVDKLKDNINQCSQEKITENIQKMETALKFVKVYTTGVSEYQTFFLYKNDEGKLGVEDNGQTHEFTDAADAVARSSEEVYIIWDGQPVGRGALAA